MMRYSEALNQNKNINIVEEVIKHEKERLSQVLYDLESKIAVQERFNTKYK